MATLKAFYRGHIFSAVLIALLGGVLYFNTLDNEFIYNDQQMVGENSFIKSLSNIKYIFDREYFTASREGTYRPLVTLTFFADHALWGNAPFGYHLTNMLFHISVALLLYMMLLLMCHGRCGGVSDVRGNEYIRRSSFIPLLAALLFVAHPVATEGAVSIGSRHDMVTTCFYLISIVLYLAGSRGQGRYGAVMYVFSLVAYFLSMSAMELGITLPAIIVVIDLLTFNSEAKWWKDKVVYMRKKLPVYAGYMLTAFLFIYIRFLVMFNPADVNIVDNYSAEYVFGTSYLTHILTVFRIIMTYVGLMFFLLRLSLEYVVYPSTGMGSREIAAILVLLLIIVIMLRAWKRYSFISFGWAWFFITILPVSNLVIPLASTRMSERFLYLPLVGFCIFLSALFHAFVNSSLVRSAKALRYIAISLVVSILCLYSVRTVARNSEWQDNKIFWEAEARTEPGSFRTHNNLAMIYYYDGRVDEAIAELRISLGILDEPLTHVNLGFVYMGIGEGIKAREEFERALAIDPLYAPAQYHLALLDNKNGNYDKAKERLEDALTNYTSIKNKPFYAETFNLLGTILAHEGEIGGAIENFESALWLKPDYKDAMYNLASVLADSGQTDLAVEEYRKILLLDPDHLLSLRALGNIYLKNGSYNEAVELYDKAIVRQPEEPSLYYALGGIYLRRGVLPKAEVEYLKVIDLAPGNVDARNNLANIWYRQGKVVKAKKEYLEILKMDPDHFRARNNLANIYLSEGLYDEAIEEYIRVIKCRPSSAAARYNLGLAYEAKGLYKEAEEQWIAVLRIDPGLKQAKEAITLLRDKISGGNR